MVRTKWAGVLVGLVAIALAALAGCSAGSGIVDNDGLRKLQDEGARIVDVRTAGEFGAGHIGGAEHVPLQSLSASAESWDRAEPIVLYCATGARSAEAAQVLRSMGFERVYDLSAGFVAWDGEVAHPGSAGDEVPPDPAAPTGGLPVVYEFYTDW
jgi:rhodanese-related sulfurtransferase